MKQVTDGRNGREEVLALDSLAARCLQGVFEQMDLVLAADTAQAGLRPLVRLLIRLRCLRALLE